MNILIEFNPHFFLLEPIQKICVFNDFDKLSYHLTLARDKDAVEQLLQIVGELYLRDHNLSMKRITYVEVMSPDEKLASNKGSILVDLPTYQRNYAKYLWVEPRQSAEHRAAHHDDHDILGRRVPGNSVTFQRRGIFSLRQWKQLLS